jgi:uncharacterized protein with PIN domain
MAKLLLDAMLGRLATYLRMCGYDAAYTLDEGLESDDEIIAFAREEGRTILTRDREIVARYDDSLEVSSRELDDQLVELASAGYRLELPETPERCSICNGSLERVTPDGPTPDYAPDTIEEDVWHCRTCGQHFWKGSHWDTVAERLAGIEAAED